MTIPALLEAVLSRALTDADEGFSPSVTPAADARFGDYQSNAAMLLAKVRRTNPRTLAAELQARLNADPELLDVALPVEVAGAGFLNFRLRPEFLATRLGELLADPGQLGVARAERPERVVIDFSSPNIAKPMHVGHLRSTVIGDCLARVARFLGHEVITDNHLGDWGTQFGLVIYGWKRFRDDVALTQDPIAELVRIYQQVAGLIRAEKPGKPEDEDAEVKAAPSVQAVSSPVTEACRQETAKLQAGDPENVAIWQRCVDLSRAELDRVYQTLGVRFDLTLGESFYHDRLAPLVERLLAQRIAEPSAGAVVIFFPEDPKLADKPALIRKRDGAFNYATTDLATLEYRVGELGATAIWIVVGMPQTLHFEQINAAGRRMGVPVPVRHVAFGSILGEDRRLMRTRSGDSVALRDLLDEAVSRARTIVEEKNAALPEDEKAEIARRIGLGAVKYADLSQHRLTDYVFSWDKMLSFQGNTAPYLQNAYVRIRSIFRRGGLDPDTLTLDSSAAGDGFVLTEPAERDLARKLAQFAEVVPAVLEDFRPNGLANYLYELAGTFHAFFEACPVLKAEGGTRATRLALCAATARTLARGLDLLGIEAPERM